MKARIFVTLLAGLFGVVWAGSAQAVPAFARKYEKTCSSCHTAWPQLNKAGRMFKEGGYSFPTDTDKTQTIGDMKWDSPLPISAILVARPYYQSGSTTKMRALHEVELIFAGRFTDKFSGYFELEMEDEEMTQAGGAVLDAFNWILMPHGAMTYKAAPGVNVQMAWAPPTWADPYDSYAGNRVLTRKPNKVTDHLGGSRQTVSVYGRTGGLFYNVGVAGAQGDAEPVVSGTGAAMTTFGRVAYDVTNDIMVGGLVVSDPATAVGTQSAVDAQADFGDTRINAAVVQESSTSASGTTSHVQAAYVMKDSNRKPTWVPLLSFAQDDAGRTYTKANVGYYFTSNAKGFLEYLNDSGGSNKLTAQFVMAF